MSITIGAPAGYAIERFDPATASEQLVTRYVDAMRTLEHEHVPEDPKPPRESVLAHISTTSQYFERRLFVARSGDEVVGGAFLGIDKSGSNAHLRQVDVGVLPEQRGRGLGRAIFAAVVEEIGETEGLVLMFWTSSRSEVAETLLARIGAEARLRMKMNQLDLRELDRALMEEWAAKDPAGYRLERIDGETPERLIANVVTAMQTMNTMPREGLEVEDWKVTPEIVRDRDRIRKERGQERRLLLAIDEATGETAAFTEFFFDPRVPHLVWQGGTATVPEHRGKHLGKWVKGRNILRVLDEMPQARYVRTNNAGSNAPMLAINEQMGFRVVWENKAWQMPIARAWEYVRR